MKAEGQPGPGHVSVCDTEWHKKVPKSLDPRNDLINHSPDGFNWGFGGSGPAQLALALLADHLEDDDEALKYYQQFKLLIVAQLPERGWKLTAAEIDDALKKIKG